MVKKANARTGEKPRDSAKLLWAETWSRAMSMFTLADA